jgi:hypothetical protein
MSESQPDPKLIDALIERTVGGVSGEIPALLKAASSHESVDSDMTRAVVEASLADFPTAVRNLPVWPELVHTVTERLLEDPEARRRLEALHRAAREAGS